MAVASGIAPRRCDAQILAFRSTMPKELITTFREFVAREQLFTHDDKLLLACSGGLDSTVLAHVLHTENYDFAIAHMNFQLRSDASDGDAAFVEELARTLGAKFYYKAVDVKGRAKPGESTQMTARWLRYEWLAELLQEHQYTFMLTAHHLDDNLETQLINLIRGTGIVGLGGIRPRFGNCVRPLLAASQSDIQQFAREHHITWREDLSNASDDYLRNAIRHHLTPILRNQFGLADKTIAKNAVNLRGGEFFYFAGLEAEREKRLRVQGEVITISREEDWTFATELTFLHHTVMLHYGFNRDQMEQICGLTRNRFLDSEKYRIYATTRQWVIMPLSFLDRPDQCSIKEFPFLHQYGEHSLTFQLIPRPTNLNQTDHLYLAPPTLPLHLRPRKNGDRFQPLGMGGKTKKVKDYMIDEKIPVWLRDRIYLLTNDQDEIMAIPGYCISEKFRVRPEDEMVLKITSPPS